MNVCFFTENHYKGGLDTFIINLINAWPDADDELTLVCNHDHPGIEILKGKIRRPIHFLKYDQKFSGESILVGRTFSRFVSLKKSNFFFRLIFALLQYTFFFPWYVTLLSLFFWRSPYDRLLVINGGYPASLICRCAIIAWSFVGKSRLGIMNFHNSTVPSAWYYKVIELIVDSVIIKCSANIVTVSQNCLNSMRHRKSFLNCNKLSYIYNGIEDPTLLLSQLPVDSCSKPYCLMLATYESRKGHFFLLQAFKAVIKVFPDVQLKIYGYGSQEERLRVANAVEELKLGSNVLLGDFLADPTPVLSGSRALLVPSQEYESFGLTVIEAMALGVPVVATDVGGIPEVLANTGAGFICSKDDPNTFASAVIRVLSDTALSKSLGLNGRTAYERSFIASVMAKSYRNLLI